MSRTKIFFDQPKPKRVPHTIRTHAHALSQLYGNETPYEGPGDNALTKRPGRGASGESSN